MSINERQLALKFCSIGFFVAIMVVLLPFYLQSYEISKHGLELFSLFICVAIATILPHILPKGIWSLSYIFFAAFALFHGGLMYVMAVGMLTDADIIYVINQWYHNQQTNEAIYLTNFTMLIYAITVIMMAKPAPPADDSADISLLRRFHHIGGLILVFATGLFFLVVVATGAMKSYTAYLTLVRENPLITNIFVYLYMLIGIAIVFVSASYRKGFGYLYFLVFASWGLFAFKMGLRGEVMFPSAVAGAMLGRRMIPIRTPQLFVLMLAVLVAIVVVKNARLSGDYSKIDNMNPLNAVAEMGGSLRTVQEVIKWREQGFELLYGASYWAPFERQIALFLPIDRPPAKKDPRLLNVVVQEKVGPIGFSPVAEVYLNFGSGGIILLGSVLGIFFAYADKIRSTVRIDVLIGVATIPLFVMIRNSFTFIPVQIILGLAIALIIIQLSKVKLEV